MFIVALTGGIATGKSTVSRMFMELGCPVVDADTIARTVVEPGKLGWSKVKCAFGPEVFHADGTLNREKLGKIVFNDASKRHLLNAITHPEIYKCMLWEVLRYLLNGHQFVILDLPLLFESGKMVPYMSYIIVVSCTDDLQLLRLKERNRMSTEDALQRIQSQMPLAEKCQRATFIIENSGDLENTRKQVEIIYKHLSRSQKHWQMRLLLGLCALGAAGVTYVALKFVCYVFS